MEKHKRRQIKIPLWEPKLDVEEFNALTDLLFETLKENSSACARVLGISRLTWKKWENTPPTWPHWNMVLRNVIKHYLSALNSRRGLTKKHRTRVMEALANIPQSDELIEDIDMLAYNLSGAQAHIRRILGRSGMSWRDLKKPANCGGYDPRTLQRAAKTLGVIKSQEGFGSDKRSYWRLPDQDDE